MRSRTWTESHHQPSRGDATDGVMQMFLRGIAESFRRAQQRRDLAALSEHSLRDIGLSRSDVDAEIQKPFWRL